MKKIVRIGTVPTYHGSGRRVSVYCEIEYENGKLSISGVIGPTAYGNAIGGCGQIDMEFAHRNPEDNDWRYENSVQPIEINFAPGWDCEMWLTFLDVWRVYHLNDMQAGCEHQRAFGWNKIKVNQDLPLTQDNMLSWKAATAYPGGLLCRRCLICGYEYGSAWMKKPVPQDVIEWLFNLPDADRQPAWV